MSVTFDAYTKELAKAFEKFQLIEQVLRDCILSEAEIERLQSSPVKNKTEDISKLTLGALVNMFSKINDNTVLHESLRNIKRDRNDVVHRSHLFTLGELNDDDHMIEATCRMKEIEARATVVHNDVLVVRYALARSLREVKRSRAKD